MNYLLEGIMGLETTQGHFTEQTVPQDTVTTIIEAAVRAPNAANRQSYSIISVNDPEVIKKYFGYQAPHALLFCIDYNRVIDSARFLNEEYEVNGIISFIHGAIDTCLAAQNAALATASLGLGQMFTNAIHRKPLDQLFTKFNLPEKYCFPLITLLIGHPTKRRNFRKGRLTNLGIVHQETYQRLNDQQLATMIEYIDHPDNHLEPVENIPKNIESYLLWYFKNWANKSNPEKQREFIARLQKSSFIL